MVGVPGRSKGCSTCRRRKIRCDLQEPFCQTCTKSRRICGGYARFPVFLNRTLQGPEKRYGLEEAKAPFLPSLDQDLSQPQPIAANIGFQRGLVESRRAYDNRILVQPNDTAVFEEQIISAFWEKYSPSDATAQDGSPCVWLQQIIKLPTRGRSLHLSLKAFAMTRIGFMSKNDSLVLQGNLTYGQALNTVQKRLSSEASMWNDELFAAGHILSVYELFESTTPSIAGWNGHISGLKHLVRARGPQRHLKPFARAIFEEFRNASMYQCIQYRKSTFLGEQDWLTVPWAETSKDIYQQVNDKGFSLAALLEKIDNTRLINGDSDISSKASEILGELFSLDEEVELWYLEILKESPSPLYWHGRHTLPDWHSQEGLSSRTPPPFTFPTLRLANTVVTHWALKLILSNAISLACQHVLSGNGQRPSESPSSTRLETSQNLESTSFHLFKKHTGAYRMELATNIVRSMPYCLDDNMGIVGAQKSLFALRTALFTLRNLPGEEPMLKWCQTMYRELDSKKGLRYAREIARLNGRYSAADRS